MIPLAAIPWRLVGYGVAAAAAVWMALLVGHWRKDSVERLPEALAALEAEVACGEGSGCAKRQAALQAEAEAKSAEVIGGLERELADLRNRPIPVRTVRLCAGTGDVQGAGAPGAPDAGTAAAGVVHGAPGPDIGGRLYALTREADEVTATCRALQEWNTALSR